MNQGSASLFGLIIILASLERVSSRFHHRHVKKGDPDFTPPDLCVKNCVNGGTCVKVHSIPDCVCLPGFGGDQCQYTTDYEQCNNNPCHNGGTCRREKNKLSCQCSMAYTGVHCEKSSVMYVVIISVPVGMVLFSIVLGIAMKFHKRRRHGHARQTTQCPGTLQTSPPVSCEMIQPPPYEEMNGPPPPYPGNEGDDSGTTVNVNGLPPPYEEPTENTGTS